MVTTDNIYVINVPETFGKAAKELTARQKRVANQPSVRKTGHLADSIGGNYIITSQDNVTTLTLTYPLYIRFLDMQYRGKGPNRKMKKKAPIYNRLVYGFLQGYIYNSLRGGLARYLVGKVRDIKIEI